MDFGPERTVSRLQASMGNLVGVGLAVRPKGLVLLAWPSLKLSKGWAVAPDPDGSAPAGILGRHFHPNVRMANRVA
ncbi:hypothetical protein HYFRA_00004255 [Hymenoscyphus fraxineus]|uniref:Uncharacterized protein n=1 Tax=Hymenoscyphus fraxineus TaxID=746836 RepID=A0A9N9PNE7_9HELO|nr:hypothetical protein HYFRA_00004255 [Hymenoscyphus fraxineus]